MVMEYEYVRVQQLYFRIVSWARIHLPGFIPPQKYQLTSPKISSVVAWIRGSKDP